jgi:hypothetical protein
MTTIDTDTTWTALEIPAPEPRGQIRAVIEGTSPLLMHNPQGMSDEAKTIPKPAEEAERGAYRWLDGQLFIPATAVYGAICNGGSGLKYRNIPQTRYGSRKLLGASITPLADGFGLEDQDGEPITAYEVDVRRALLRNGAKKVGVLRARPLVPAGWRTTLLLEYDPSSVGEAIVQVISDALVQGGLVAGLLDYRPQLGGPFGRFRVLEFGYRS